VTAGADHLLRAPDVLEATGATYRQLDYWSRQGLVAVADAEPANAGGQAGKPIEDVTNPGSGRAKLWHPDEVEAVRRAVIVARAFPHLTNDAVFQLARATAPVVLHGGIVVTCPWSAP
jgi:hypothetical protein